MSKKKLSLTPVTFGIPRDVSPEMARILQRAETAIRENNALIENAINNMEITYVVQGNGESTAELVNGILHIS